MSQAKFGNDSAHQMRIKDRIEEYVEEYLPPDTRRWCEHYKGKKVIVWKYRPRKRYRRKYGHRQYYTRLRIDDIVPPKAKAAKAEPKAESPAKKESAPKESAPSKPSPRKTLAGLDVSDRVASALEEGGISTAGAFIKALEEGGDAALLAIKGFGQKGLEEVKQILADAGYDLP